MWKNTNENERHPARIPPDLSDLWPMMSAEEDEGRRRCWGPDSSRLLKPCRIFHWPPIRTFLIVPLHPHPAPHLQQFQYISSPDSAAHCQFVSGSIRLSSMFCRIDFLVSAWLILDLLSSSLLSEGVCSATCNLLVPRLVLVHHWLRVSVWTKAVGAG